MDTSLEPSWCPYTNNCTSGFFIPAHQWTGSIRFTWAAANWVIHTQHHTIPAIRISVFIQLIRQRVRIHDHRVVTCGIDLRSEEHTSELQSLMRISYAVFCLKKKNKIT